MRSDMFAEDVVVADFEPRRLAGITSILRRAPEHRKRRDPIAKTHTRARPQDGVRLDLRAVSDEDARLNHSERPDPHALAERCRRIHQRKRM